jgi:hypothetical protein
VKCYKVKRILGAYLDGELSKRKNLYVQRHLERCAVCSWELKSFQKIDELGRWSPEIASLQLPEGYWDNFPAGLNAKLKQRISFQQSNIFNFFSSYLRIIQAYFVYWLKKFAPGLTVIGIMVILILGIIYVKDRFFKIAQLEHSNEKNVVINFYLKEHHKAIMEVDYSIQVSPREIELGYENIFYYNTIKDSDRLSPGEAGLIIRAPYPNGIKTSTDPSRAKNIVNGRNLTFQEAAEAVSFNIVASQTLYPGYFLESIKKIEKEECLQLIYTNGINTLSLFEQTLGSNKKFQSNDFREYVFYSEREKSAINILGWNNKDISFTLIGEEDLSQLMRIIREIQKGYLIN